MREFIEQLKNIWNKMDNTRRWILVVSVAVVLVSILLISWLTSRPKFELLYSKLDEESKAQIIVKLNEMKVIYRETASGGIAVPNATNVRASLLQQGIPNGGSVGYEIFDKNSFSDTDFTNSIKKQRAITGEIERTLRKLSGIDDAKVMLNMPESSEYIFADDKPDGTASVQLTLREPGILSENQVSSILNMVKGATGLKPENITVVDNFANDLTAALKPTQGRFNNGRPGTNNLNATADRFFYTTQYNKQMAREIEGLLARVFSFKKVKAVVNAELDFDYQETQSETFAPKGTVRSEQHKSETYEGTGANSVGIPGTDSNITQYKAPDAGTSNYKGDKSEDTLNYEISNVKQFTINSPGKVKRQSVSVLVDANLNEDIKQSVYKLARNAAGIVDERGDTISVETFTLTTPPVKAAKPLPWTTIIIAAVLGILLITLIVLVIIKEPVPQQIETVKTIKLEPEPPPPPIIIREKASEGSAGALGAGGIGKHKKERRQQQPAMETRMEVEEDMPIPIVGTKIDKIIEDRAQREQTGATTDEVFLPEPELTPEEKLRQERLKAIEKLALEKPAEVAVLLRAWLSEE